MKSDGAAGHPCDLVWLAYCFVVSLVIKIQFYNNNKNLAFSCRAVIRRMVDDSFRAWSKCGDDRP